MWESKVHDLCVFVPMTRSDGISCISRGTDRICQSTERKNVIDMTTEVKHIIENNIFYYTILDYLRLISISLTFVLLVGSKWKVGYLHILCKYNPSRLRPFYVT